MTMCAADCWKSIAKDWKPSAGANERGWRILCYALAGIAYDEFEESKHPRAGNGQFGAGASEGPSDNGDGEPRLEGYPESSGDTPYGEFDGKDGKIGDCVLVSSQEFRDEDTILSKQDSEDFAVQLSPEFEYEGVKMRVVLDGHHSLSAALKSGKTPDFSEASAQENDHVTLLEDGKFDDFFEQTRMDSDLHNPVTGGDIW